VTIRVPDRLKREMHKVKSVNWSALLRDAIKARIELEHRATTRNWERVREAGVRADTIYEEMASKYGHIDFNSAETIRHWREVRSRGMSQTPQSR
jgi:predicted transcriptional regulator